MQVLVQIFAKVKSTRTTIYNDASDKYIYHFMLCKMILKFYIYYDTKSGIVCSHQNAELYRNTSDLISCHLHFITTVNLSLNFRFPRTGWVYKNLLFPIKSYFFYEIWYPEGGCFGIIVEMISENLIINNL